MSGKLRGSRRTRIVKLLHVQCHFFLNWWIISDLIPSVINDCEIMAKQVCNASFLKDHDYRLKSLSFSRKICSECTLGIREDLLHMVMQRPDTEDIRREMYEVIYAIEDDHVKTFLLVQQVTFFILIGKHPPDIPFQSIVKIWLISSHCITMMYRDLIKKRLL